MIAYNSHQTKSLMRWRGSVLPQAVKWAAGAAAFAFVMKHLQLHYMPEGLLGDLEISPAAYSGFSFTLGFVIVFRTSQCYNRFWTCATHVNAMRAEWYEAASGLTTFVVMSKHSAEEQDRFSHKVVRYFSLLHSLALQALADGDAFPVIDLESLPAESLKLVLESGTDAEGMTARVELVYQWIQALIVHSVNSGLLNVPPPILTRVLQQMTAGMVNYNSVLDIISIPFPFPYAQVTFVLLTVYVCFIPIVMCLLVNAAWIAAWASFLSVLCLISVDLVSTEIENPFGDDANDLPCHEFQHKMNSALMNLLHPAANEPPELCANALLSFEELHNAKSSFTICDATAQKFHGGKLKPMGKGADEAKPLPQKKDTQAKADNGNPASVSVTISSSAEPKPQEKKQAASSQESARGADSLLSHQSAMLGEFTQSLATMFERMDKSFTAHDALTSALTEQLSSLSEVQTKLFMQQRMMPAAETSRSNMSKGNSVAGEVVPNCLSWSNLMSRPTTPQASPGSQYQQQGFQQQGGIEGGGSLLPVRRN